MLAFNWYSTKFYKGACPLFDAYLLKVVEADCIPPDSNNGFGELDKIRLVGYSSPYLICTTE